MGTLLDIFKKKKINALNLAGVYSAIQNSKGIEPDLQQAIFVASAILSQKGMTNQTIPLLDANPLSTSTANAGTHTHTCDATVGWLVTIPPWGRNATQISDHYVRVRTAATATPASTLRIAYKVDIVDVTGNIAVTNATPTGIYPMFIRPGESILFEFATFAAGNDVLSVISGVAIN